MIFTRLPSLAILAHFCTTGLATPHAARARVVKSAEAAQHAYDYVIVGAGTAGLTLADRLTEDGKCALRNWTLRAQVANGVLDTVLVVEIGGLYNPEAPTESDCSFSVPSVPQTNLLNRSATALVGNCVGGSSAINGMVLMRGTVRDYDIWAELGGRGSDWSWKDMFPYFKKAVHLREPDPQYAAEFNITYDPGVWGKFSDTRVYSSWSPTMRQAYSRSPRCPKPSSY